jgi:uncharacterized membrane protein YhaH (DUF805 family)
VAVTVDIRLWTGIGCVLFDRDYWEEIDLNWYLEVLKKYTVFSGRAGRPEYWYFVLFNIIVSIVLGILDGIFGTVNGDARIGLLGGIYSLAVLCPSIAVGIRRLHDTNRSGWWLLIALIPIVGAIILIVYLAQQSDSGANQYGTQPAAAPAG